MSFGWARNIFQTPKTFISRQSNIEVWAFFATPYSGRNFVAKSRLQHDSIAQLARTPVAALWGIGLPMLGRRLRHQDLPRLHHLRAPERHHRDMEQEHADQGDGAERAAGRGPGGGQRRHRGRGLDRFDGLHLGALLGQNQRQATRPHFHFLQRDATGALFQTCSSTTARPSTGWPSCGTGRSPPAPWTAPSPSSTARR